jgi:pyridinium-3,5-bisthiocarboxylic acid mononucleotide nickel chelatase
VRVAHFDCFSGISGDMTLAALFDAGVPIEPVRAALASLGLPLGVEVEKVRKGGFAATYVRIEAPEEHTHRFLADVEEIIARGKLSERQATLARKIFRRLAEAEAAVHGMPLEKVHFHEVGALDSIADIIGAAVALDLLGVEHFSSGPVAVGSGTVQCAHGLMPVPAPATAELLKGVALRTSSVQAELTTPTGAAILTTVVNQWIEQPAMTIESVGHGAGRRNFVEQPNLLRLFVGTMNQPSPANPGGAAVDQIWMLETNLDDVPAEIIGYCFDLLFAAGALDVFTTPIFMKKNRPGVMLSVLTNEATIGAMEEILFRETLTFGIRRHSLQRHKLHRRPHTVTTKFGDVRGKLGWLDGRPPVFTPEFDDCARLAQLSGVSLQTVADAAVAQWRSTHNPQIPEGFDTQSTPHAPREEGRSPR